jgi:membrane-associated protease RseP (regulator of RpoE activity)
MNDPTSMTRPDLEGPVPRTAAADDELASLECIAAPMPATSARATDEIEYIAAAPGQTIDEVLLTPRIRRRWRLPLFLFLATCVTTFFAGVYQWQPDLPLFDRRMFALVEWNWRDGLAYMSAVVGILLAHEMGHFLMTVRYHVPASYPIFIPVPWTVLGTMGAVIAMDGSRANRKQVFDIGVAGPLAGLVVAIPVLCLGVLNATLVVPGPDIRVTGDPLFAELLIRWLRPDAGPGAEVYLPGNPLYMAGWVGLLITGLNMMPISQLDGGHVIYALFRQKAHYLARAFLMTAIAYMVFSENYTWTLMVVIVTFLGTDHPPTADDRVSLGRARYALGLASLAIPVLCFIPNPF